MTLRRLFIIYIVALLLVPCRDTKVCLEPSMVHHEDTQEDDVCPPFCICQCCHTAVEEINLFVWSKSEPKLVGPQNELVVQIVQAIQHNIWQPPRLN